MVTEDVKVAESRSGVLTVAIGKMKVKVTPKGDDVCGVTIRGSGSPLEVAMMGSRLGNLADLVGELGWRGALECADACGGSSDLDGIRSATVASPKPSGSTLTVVEYNAPDDPAVVSVAVRSADLTVKADFAAGLNVVGMVGRALWDVGIATKRDPLGIPTAETVRAVLDKAARRVATW